ncbi:alanine--glyoxylate aminotransferase family protein [Peptoniphilus equinus]|uniref:Alanine--glyoxylate aminotransferase family protein n=1 Tax=Peptoniphilus equinus TaxID=3016343 RepID=A0ABY7QT61_9FIRM|nr:alanine--glyoxylate aminotransferase family protein [Peptoniphilus equinus]WBW49967.1 alanine--glyoxylate aminotransferase family protein [Peptoniphilus equinus]
MKILCAGPTTMANNVREQLSVSKTNPDLDPTYAPYQRRVEAKLSALLHTTATSFFMLGEGIMGLEAAIFSLVEPEDRVLVLSNGFFGGGFAEYVKHCGGKAHVLNFEYDKGIDIETLHVFLEQDHDFKVATFVHCETPTGVTNDLVGISQLLKRYGILVITDCVSSMGGEDIHFDETGVDVMLGGSQKVLSAPVGLSLVTLSEDAKRAIASRRTPILSYYLNFKNHYDFNGAPFPYTMNENLIYAMDAALDNLMAKDAVTLHRTYSELTRRIVTNAGLKLYAKDSFSNTVTAVKMPDGIPAEALLQTMRERGIAISKGVSSFSDDLFRIGHMGENISYDNFLSLFEALDDSFRALGVTLNASMKDAFLMAHLYGEV